MNEILIIGNVTNDITERGLIPGGTALYTSILLHRFGYKVRLWTSFGNDFAGKNLIENIDVALKHSDFTTTYKNIYTAEGRIQYLYKTASRLNFEDIKEDFLTIPFILFAPIYDEISFFLLSRFKNAFKALCPQGWFRKKDNDNKITYYCPEAFFSALKDVNICFLSEEDIAFEPEIIEKIKSTVPITILTLSEQGSIVFLKENFYKIPAPIVNVVDPTGAGDIYAAAFLLKFLECKDPLKAGYYASYIASYSVTKVGINGIAEREILKECEKFWEKNIEI